MFVFFIGFLQRFLSPPQPWHHSDPRNTGDFRTADTFRWSSALFRWWGGSGRSVEGVRDIMEGIQECEAIGVIPWDLRMFRVETWTFCRGSGMFKFRAAQEVLVGTFQCKEVLECLIMRGQNILIGFLNELYVMLIETNPWIITWICSFHQLDGLFYHLSTLCFGSSNSNFYKQIWLHNLQAHGSVYTQSYLSGLWLQ